MRCCGAFRFVTGSQNPRSYSVKTPIGTIGVRGTIVDLIVGYRHWSAVILVEGSLTITVNGVDLHARTGRAPLLCVFGETAECRGR